jgi:hypothetical protein
MRIRIHNTGNNRSPRLIAVELLKDGLPAPARPRGVSRLRYKAGLHHVEQVHVVLLGLAEFDEVEAGLGTLLREQVHSEIPQSGLYHHRHYVYIYAVLGSSLPRLKYEKKGLEGEGLERERL